MFADYCSGRHARGRGAIALFYCFFTSSYRITKIPRLYPPLFNTRVPHCSLLACPGFWLVFGLSYFGFTLLYFISFYYVSFPSFGSPCRLGCFFDFPFILFVSFFVFFYLCFYLFSYYYLFLFLFLFLFISYFSLPMYFCC